MDTTPCRFGQILHIRICDQTVNTKAIRKHTLVSLQKKTLNMSRTIEIKISKRRDSFQPLLIALQVTNRQILLQHQDQKDRL